MIEMPGGTGPGHRCGAKKNMDWAAPNDGRRAEACGANAREHSDTSGRERGWAESWVTENAPGD